MRTVLIVDDEPKIVQLARDYLEHAGFAVLTAGDGPSAIQAVRTRRPDLVVLDLGLPHLDGLDVTRTLRAESSTPIVMLTARDDELDKLLGLELGADDYITKPFSPRELVARVRALMRRVAAHDAETAAAPAKALMSFDDGRLIIDDERHELTLAGARVNLTPSEWRLLVALAESPGRVYSRFELINRVQGYDYEGYERTMDAHVKNLRRKIEPDPGRPTYVETVHGVGYRLAAPAA